jgi:ferritin-like metal-binding protein YciE
VIAVVKDIVEVIKEYGVTVVGFVVLLGVFIQITPIKINPLSWVLKQIKQGLAWLGRQINAELKEEINKYRNELKEHIEQADSRFETAEIKEDEKRIKDLRWEILDFGNSVKTKTYHKDAFDHIFESYAEYEELIFKYKRKNGQTDRAMKLIKNIYNERQYDPDF